MTVLELAQKYYPVLWDDNRLRQLVEATPPKLTTAEYQAVTGKVYAAKQP